MSKISECLFFLIQLNEIISVLGQEEPKMI